jgi:hypothetical protein
MKLNRIASSQSCKFSECSTTACCPSAGTGDGGRGRGSSPFSASLSFAAASTVIRASPSSVSGDSVIDPLPTSMVGSPTNTRSDLVLLPRLESWGDSMQSRDVDDETGANGRSRRSKLLDRLDRFDPFIVMKLLRRWFSRELGQAANALPTKHLLLSGKEAVVSHDCGERTVLIAFSERPPLPWSTSVCV